jgi:hypothetical protein
MSYEMSHQEISILEQFTEKQRHYAAKGKEAESADS